MSEIKEIKAKEDELNEELSELKDKIIIKLENPKPSYNHLKLENKLIKPVYDLFYKNSINEDIDDGSYYLFVHVFYFQSNDKENALKYLILAHKKNEQFGSLHLMHHYNRCKNYVKVVEIFEESIKFYGILTFELIDPGELFVIIAYKEINYIERYFGILMSYVNKTEFDMNHHLAMLFEQMGNNILAKSLYISSYEKGDLTAAKFAADILYGEEKYEEALSYYLKVNSDEWTNNDLLKLKCYLELEDYDNARKILKESKHIDNTDLDSIAFRFNNNSDRFDLSICCYIYEYLNENVQNKVKEHLPSIMEYKYEIKDCAICYKDKRVLTYTCLSCKIRENERQVKMIHSCCAQCFKKLDRCPRCKESITRIL